jgi:hypothetical protein
MHSKWRWRHVVEVEVECAMTSCGYGVPVMAFVRDRSSADRGRKSKVERLPKSPAVKAAD